MKFALVDYSHDLEDLSNTFDCGNQNINYFLRNQALIPICKTYVLLDKTNLCILGFFSLSADALMEKEHYLEKSSLKQLGSAIRINMFAIDKKYQHKRVKVGNDDKCTIASILLDLCITTIQEIVDKHVGSSFIILSATKRGYGLYKHKGGFNELENDMQVIESERTDNSIHMYRDVFPEE